MRFLTWPVCANQKQLYTSLMYYPVYVFYMTRKKKTLLLQVCYLSSVYSV